MGVLISARAIGTHSDLQPRFARLQIYASTFDIAFAESTPTSLSAINAENQQIAKQTPSFTPKNVKLGVFVFF